MAVLPVSKVGHVQAAVTASPSVKEKRRREKEKELRKREKARRKKEKRRQKRLKLKRQGKRRNHSSSNSLGNFKGIDVVKVSGGRGLRWGQGRGVGRDARPPPFTMLLSSVDDNSEIQSSGETRTKDTEPAALLPRQMARTGRRRGRLPESSSGTSYLVPPPPEEESPQATPQRDWKRRRA